MVRRIELILPTNGTQSPVRAKYHVSNSPARKSFVGISAPWGQGVATPLAHKSGGLLTRFGNIWNVEIPAVVEFDFEFECEWRSMDPVIRYPPDVPQPMRDLGTPKALIPVTVTGSPNGLVITRLAPQDWQEGMASVELREAQVVERVPLASAPVDVCFLGAEWAERRTSDRSVVVRHMSEVLKLLLVDRGCTPTGTIGVLLGSLDSGLWSIDSTVVIVDPQSLDCPDTLELREGLLWQLSKGPWYGLTRIHGKDEASLVFALRLQSAVAARNEMSDTSIKAEKFSDRILGQFGTLAMREPELRRWYERTATTSRVVMAWCASQRGAAHALDQIASELCGKEVDIRWLRERLNQAGFPAVDR